MANGTIRISTSEVMQIASQLEKINTNMREVLDNTQSTIQGLSDSWVGTAADTTINAYNSFAKKYFDNYQQVIEGYVTFLRRNVSEQYEETEQVNTKIADMLK